MKWLFLIMAIIELLLRMMGGGGIPTPPSITLHPQNQSVTEGNTATFTVAATGTAPIDYAWHVKYVGNPGYTPLGAVGTSYTTPALTPANDGDIYMVLVNNPAGTVQSDDAVLEVLSDK